MDEEVSSAPVIRELRTQAGLPAVSPSNGQQQKASYVRVPVDPPEVVGVLTGEQSAEAKARRDLISKLEQDSRDLMNAASLIREGASARMREWIQALGLPDNCDYQTDEIGRVFLLARMTRVPDEELAVVAEAPAPVAAEPEA